MRRSPVPRPPDRIEAADAGRRPVPAEEMSGDCPAMNFYKTDLEAIRFTLYEHLGVQQLFKLDRFAQVSREDCDAVIAECLRLATEVTGPINGPGDRAGCRLEGGRVVTPAGFKEAWRR